MLGKHKVVITVIPYSKNHEHGMLGTVYIEDATNNLNYNFTIASGENVFEIVIDPAARVSIIPKTSCPADVEVRMSAIRDNCN